MGLAFTFLATFSRCLGRQSHCNSSSRSFAYRAHWLFLFCMYIFGEVGSAAASSFENLSDVFWSTASWRLSSASFGFKFHKGKFEGMLYVWITNKYYYIWNTSKSGMRSFESKVSKIKIFVYVPFQNRKIKNQKYAIKIQYPSYSVMSRLAEPVFMVNFFWDTANWVFCTICLFLSSNLFLFLPKRV